MAQGQTGQRQSNRLYAVGDVTNTKIVKSQNGGDDMVQTTITMEASDNFPSFHFTALLSQKQALKYPRGGQVRLSLSPASKSDRDRWQNDAGGIPQFLEDLIDQDQQGQV